MKVLFSLFLSLNLFSSFANAAIAESTNPRILNLLPDNLLVALTIDPALPDNFVAMTPNPDCYDWIYWGPKEVLETYFLNPNSLDQPIIRFTAGNVQQYEIENSDTQPFRSSLKQKGFSEIKESRLRWGNYPVYGLQGASSNSAIFLAWVGLNDTAASTLKFQLIYPTTHAMPTKEDIHLWDNFLNNTKKLSGRSLMQAYGQILEIGCTFYEKDGIKLKITAEERMSDGNFQVSVIPLKKNVDFNLIATDFIHLTLDDTEDPAVKLTGRLIQEDLHSRFVLDNCCIYVLIKKVSEFSSNREANHAANTFQI